jgi:predicted enzyme related to lactoylglutathione lyase
MTEVTSHEPGSFTWAELSTSDPKAAKAFYTALFGWSAVDNPMGQGPDDIYTRLQIGGKDVGALFKMRPEQAAMGAPPNWGTYFTVKSADESAKKAKAAGGKIVVEPFDVMDYGRMAVVMGPEGAAFSIWQPGTHYGFQRVGEDNTAGWTELQTKDAAKSTKFLADVFGWAMKEDPKGAYTEFKVGGKSIGGIRPMGADDPFPPHWLIYIQLADCDATVKKAQSLGAKVLMPAMDVEKVGRFAVLADPQGAVFAVIKLASG